MKNTLKAIKLNENTVSLALSGMAVVMVMVLIFNYFQSVNKAPGQTSSSSTDISQNEAAGTYTVQEGDSLWLIAEAKYGSGYQWNELYNINKDKISDPNILETGIQLRLLADNLKNQHKETTYSVRTGDSLWSIAQEKCGDGYTWSKIARDNQLDNPSVIHAGNVLKISCQ